MRAARTAWVRSGQISRVAACSGVTDDGAWVSRAHGDERVLGQ